MPSRLSQYGSALGAGIGSGIQGQVEQQNKLRQLQRQLEFLGQQDPNAMNVFQQAALGVSPPSPTNPADIAKARLLNQFISGGGIGGAVGQGSGSNPLRLEGINIDGFNIKRNPNLDRPISQKFVETAAEAQNIFTGIQEATEAIKQTPSRLKGPVAGRTLGQNPFAADARQAESKVRAESQRFGRYMEGGVLRKEDEAKYFRIFPQLTDLPQVVEYKNKNLQRMFAQDFNNKLKNLRDSGFDTQGITEIPVPDLPEVGKAFSKQVKDVEKATKQLQKNSSEIIPEFGSVGEAESSGLPVGTEVIIDGRRAILE